MGESTLANSFLIEDKCRSFNRREPKKPPTSYALLCLSSYFYIFLSIFILTTSHPPQKRSLRSFCGRVFDFGQMRLIEQLIHILEDSLRFTLSEQLKIAKRTYIYVSSLVEILQECRPHRDIPHTQQLPCWNEQGWGEKHILCRTSGSETCGQMRLETSSCRASGWTAVAD
jgi:hypothetical protein